MRTAMILPALVAISLLSMGVLTSCITQNVAHDRGDPIDPRTSTAGEAVAEAALSLAEYHAGGNTINVRGRRYTLDCSGTILAIHYKAGIDLAEAFSREVGNGVARLWAIGEETTGEIAPGDVVFWDNTYDRRGNGLWDDELTHAGVVVAVGQDGTITYVHHNYRRGIIAERMNLSAPDDTTRNSAMRKRGDPDPAGDRWLASHLFRGARRMQ